MATDPSIALQVQPAQFQNPLAAYAQIAGIQNAQQQNQLTGLAIQQAQRQETQADALNNAFKAPGAVNPDGSLNSSGILTNVANAGAGSAIPALSKQLTDATTAQLTQQKARVENATTQLNAVGQVLNGVHDQASWDAARAWAHTNLGASALDNAPAVYNPDLVAQAKNQALTAQQSLDQHNKELDYALSVRNADETARHNSATEASTIRGQDLTAQTEQRGQNMRALDYDSKNGVVVNKVTGQTVQVPGISGANNLTQDQANAVAFGARALDAQGTLRQLEAGGTTNTNPINRVVSALPGVGGTLGAATNWLNSDQQQSYDQAKRNFVSAVLRKESGAAISQDEFANEDKKYFPQAGDSAATIEQKARARDLAIEGLKAQAGQGASLIPGIISAANQDYSTQPRGAQQQQPAAQTNTAPAQVAPDLALAELRRRAANNPALAAKLQAMGH
ncbi:hypothetical protein [Paraburkholderia caribensis]|uniref:hypothetical protein n=1 Tax=Paraburkholderia caribensis TaxID=75105 RepID=UPI001CAC6B1B|nr:hypothetical protein [Paraburkholderia caribensis]CAG9256008.1 conserved hypothetical protein [Paraburkholderia caribensis]